MTKAFNKVSILKIAALIFILSLFTLTIFEACHAGHQEHCHEENCQICLLLQIIHNTRNFLSGAKQTSPESFHSYIKIIIIHSVLLLAPATLVRQKVKLVIQIVGSSPTMTRTLQSDMTQSAHVIPDTARPAHVIPVLDTGTYQSQGIKS